VWVAQINFSGSGDQHMKKPKKVVEAQEFLAVKAEEVKQAKDRLKRLEDEYRDAQFAVRDAQTEADSNLPQCRLINKRWSTVEQLGRVVILRKTPTGMLVVRSVGVPDGYEYRFKWAPYSGCFRGVERIGCGNDVRELQDVPVEFLPDVQTA
jgi:hypothetical protein